MVHWRELERKPEPIQELLGHDDEPPMNDNYFATIISGFTSLLMFVFFGAAAVFIPLAIVFFPVIIGMDFMMPLVLMYLPLWLLRHLDSVVDEGIDFSAWSLCSSQAWCFLCALCSRNLKGDESQKGDEPQKTDGDDGKEKAGSPELSTEAGGEDEDDGEDEEEDEDEEARKAAGQMEVMKLKAIAAAVMCSIAVSGSFATFYQGKGWVDATRTLRAALEVFYMEITFKAPDLTFSWPFALPGKITRNFGTRSRL